MNDLYQPVKDCRNCPEEGTAYGPQRHLYLFPEIGTLDFVALDTAGPSEFSPGQSVHSRHPIAIQT